MQFRKKKEINLQRAERNEHYLKYAPKICICQLASKAQEVTDIKHIITSVMSAMEQHYGDAGKNNLTPSRGSGTAA